MAEQVSPLAIVGLGGRFPGKATDPLKLWEMCSDGEDAWTETPSTRFNPEAYYHPDQARNGATNVKGGFFLREDVARFDAPFFNMTKAEAASLDPQQRLLLEGTYEALENAGIPLDHVSGSDMGVFVGSFCFDWAKITLRDPDALPLYHATGSGQAMLANRVSYYFNMHGPSVTMDTACSSSLVALHQACQALRAGECSAAVVAGVNCLLCQDSLGSMSTMGFLSPDGRSYTYDSRANGYGRGEGVAVIVLKRLDRALQEGDAVRAIVRNTGVNQDGRTPGITFPSGTAQAALIRRVYAQARLNMADTSYLEAHGTGTQAGDPIEAGALHETFGLARASAGKGPLVVGCVKTNIGHLEGAAGAAGLVKTVMMLEREAILPNAGFRSPNTKIPLAEWNLEVPTTLRPWRDVLATSSQLPRGRLPVLRASVNGFGYGGTNAHVILENAADYIHTCSMAASMSGFRHGHSLSLDSSFSTATSASVARSHSAASSTSSPPTSPIAESAMTKEPLPVEAGATVEQSAAAKLIQTAKTTSEVEAETKAENGGALPLLPEHLARLNRSTPKESFSKAAKLRVPHLFVLTAADEASGKTQAAQLATYMEEADKPEELQLLEDLAFTLATRRSGLAWKAAVAAASGAELREALSGLRFQQTVPSSSKKMRAGWVFTGQGAQWWAMGRELARTSTAFRVSLDRSAAVLTSSALQADWSLDEELLQRDAETSRVNEPAVSQTLCTIVQVALVDMLRAWGLRPSAVVGHSSGEIGAAYAAGLLSHEAAVAAAYFRVPLDSEAAQACRGGMVALACSEAETLALLDGLQRGGRAVIACYNSPQSFTVSGDDSAVDELVDVCRERGIRHRKLVVAFAYHSHRMAVAAEDYRRLLQANRTVMQTIDERQIAADDGTEAPAVMFSSVTGAKLAPGALTADYWVDNLVNPVRFTEALMALCKDGGGKGPAVDALVEVGPHSALAGPIRQILQVDPSLGSKVGVLGVLRRNQDATETAQALAAALFSRGLAIDIAAVNKDARTSPAFGPPGMMARLQTIPRLLTNLPKYPWNHATAYWGEPRESWRYRTRTHGRHDLLGAPVRFGNPLEPRWRQWIRTAETPWIRDHRVQGLVVYPAAGYLSMAIEAARQTASTTAEDGVTIAGYELRDVSLGQALIVPDDTGEVEAQISLRPLAENAQDNSTVWHEFFVYSCSDSTHSSTNPMGTPVVDRWSEHCRGQIAVRWKTSEAADSDLVTDMDALRRERARLDAAVRAETEALCTRDVDLVGLYAYCTAIGLEYGPTFANLTNARSGRSATDDSRRISGTVTVPDIAAVMPAHYHSPIVVHPGTLDACLHGIMAFRELLQAAVMPVYFGYMYVAAELGQMDAGDALGVYLNVKRSGFRNLNIELTGWNGAEQKTTAAAAGPLIRMEGLRMTSLGGSMGGNGSSGLPSKTYFQTAWRPDPAFLTPGQFDALCAHLMPAEAETELLRRLDQSSFYMADGALAQIPADRVALLSVKGRKLYGSLQRQRDAVLRVQAEEVARKGAEAVARRAVHVSDMASWPNAAAEERAAQLAELEQTATAEGPLLAAVTASMHKIVLGEADPLEVTMKGDVLGRYYALNPRMARQYQQAAVFVDLLAHKNPAMRIMEIGTGTGGATLPLLEALGRPDGASGGTVPRFETYDVTDISSGFFEAVRAKTRPWQSQVRFRRLDIERPPTTQGFEAGTYDLVVAANVLHATHNISRTVAHARSLLRPGGRLLLIELVVVPEQRVCSVATLFGIFDGWWKAEEAHRQESPLLAESQWDEVLRQNGFSGLDAAVWETSDVATHQGSMMISTAVAEMTLPNETVEPLKAFADISKLKEVDGWTELQATPTIETVLEAFPELAEHTVMASEPVVAVTADVSNHVPPDTTLPPVVLVTDSASQTAWLQQVGQALMPSLSSPVMLVDEAELTIPDGHTVVFYQTDASTLGAQTAESMEWMRRLFVRPADTAAANVLWLTRGTASGENAPDFSLVQGLMRTLRVELGGRLVHLDLEVTESSADIGTVARVFAQSFGRTGQADEDSIASTMEVELELAVREGMVHLPRYVEQETTGEYVATRMGRRHLVDAPAVQPGRNLKLEVGQPGQLDSLFFDDDTRLLAAGNDNDNGRAAPLADDEIEVAVQAAGVNFHDVMVAMGQLANRSLGIECAGIVTRIGARVSSRLQVGDRVAGPSDGTFATTVRLAAWRAQKVPDHVSTAAAAGLPIVLCTAVHSLRVARLAAGDTVLIHAAAGGLGQALVQLCQQRGATVLATAGTPTKKRFLVERCGLAAHHVFSSRDASFAEAVLQVTGGRGVDVVFNVLAGELLHASWRCVAPFGHFIELGKRDLQRHGRLDMAPFLRNVTFAAVDLITLLADRPDYGARLWAESMDLVRQGVARVPEPLATYALADAISALRTMQAGRHIGKLVLVADSSVTPSVTTTTNPNILARVMSPRVPRVQLPADASYLLVGGLGGIGRALAARMVHELGARHLIFLSRGGITSDVAASTVARLRAAGAHVLACNCDVASDHQLAAALQAASEAGFPPIRGAVHLGLVLESALFQDMSSAAWNNSLAPKVAGTWNLHRQLPANLDFFVLLSSMVGIIGNPSQTAYGAASAFQDAFARYRRRRCQAATTINLGMITGIGYVAEHSDVQKTLRTHGFDEIDGPECLAIIEAAFSAPPDATNATNATLSHPKSATASATATSMPLLDANILTGLGLGRYTGGDIHRPSYLEPRFAQARHLAQSATDADANKGQGTADAADTATQSIRARLRAADALSDILALLEAALRAKIVSLLMLPSEDDLDVQKPLSQYGLDSLIAVELRNWVASEMEATVPVLEFLGSRTVQSLAGFIARQSRLVKKELLATEH
ncbi:polyketide synthase [Grosmannia clavigera kw1407]|uniref:Polyketide synthase n=1 Tax=Grosmannia clavigera (strain kw1407 / UAMH 11150) TaxID=655863 RepID=F0XJA7_GROCL|nr:polyketide synthase [Grosmannia clavigera kw1407]EFX02355.1 polyketide synthase [Grosmannia clavigera kw1407]